MTADCASCFFAFIAPIDADPVAAPSRVGKRFCNRNAPSAQSNNPNVWLWPLVADDFWCGEGADAITGLSYAAVVNSIPGPGSSAGHSVYSGPTTPPAFPAVDGDLYFYYGTGTLKEVWAMNITWTLIANHFPP